MTQYFRYVALTLIGAYAVLAQVSTGTITGYVHDASEAAIVGAKVSILETQTGERRETVTNERGDFNAPYLQRGTYSVTVTANGFKTELFTTIILAVD
jgi:hypothetical protein